MDRRSFLTRFAAALTIMAVAPEQFLSEPAAIETKLETLDVAIVGPLNPKIFFWTWENFHKGISRITGGMYYCFEDLNGMIVELQVPKQTLPIIEEWVSYIRPTGVEVKISELLWATETYKGQTDVRFEGD
jgi:hypothetical protein